MRRQFLRAGLSHQREQVIVGGLAIARVYVEALREKAETLGEVAGVSETRSGSELVLEIKVKVAD